MNQVVIQREALRSKSLVGRLLAQLLIYMSYAAAALLLCLVSFESVSLGQTVPENAIEDWKLLDRELAKISGTLVENRPFGRTTTFFAFNGKLSKFESVTESKRGVSKEVLFANGKNAFRLKENPQNHNLFCEVTAPEGCRWLRDAQSNVKACNSVMGFSLLQILESPDFEFTDWHCDTSGLCVVTITCIAPKGVKEQNEYLDSLQIELDKNAKHRVTRRIESRTVPVKQTVDRRYEYGNGVLPTRVVIDITFDGAATITQESFYQGVSKEVPPPSAFELTHYGIPE